ncbi:T9SS type A sorting domain-containing protein [bacterium]|nr:T9SS type A sorting domain-containing protein [bacterium]
MSKRNCSRSTIWTICMLGALLVVGLSHSGLAQVPEISNLTVSSSGGNNSIDESVDAAYSLSGSATTAATAWNHNGQPTMAYFMPFEGGATAARDDLSGNGVVTSLVGSPTWSATSGHDSRGAYTFSNGNYLRAASGFPTSSSYTIAAWINRSTTSGYAFILGSDNSTGGHGFRITYDGRISAGQNGNWKIAESNRPREIAANTWYHVAVSFDHASRAMVLYLNGNPIDTAIVDVNDADVSDGTIQIGAVGGTTPFVGRIDDLRIYRSALTTGQMAELHLATGPNRIAPSELSVGDTWQAHVTPFSASAKGITYTSNTLTILATAPAFTSTPVASGIVGKRYRSYAEATGGPAPTFALVSGPAGMTVDPNTGLVFWIPGVAGSYPVTISADNSQGTDLQNFSITVADPTVGVANVVLQPLGNDDLQASYDLALNATTAATAWYKEDQPIMTLFMPFEGGPEFATEDYSGNQHDALEITGNPVWLADGGHDGNGAFEFDGSSFLNCGSIFPTLSSYTKTAWFYRTASREFTHILSGWDHNTAATGGHGLRCSFDDRLGAGQNGDWRLVQSEAGAVTLNEWHFAAVTFDYASGMMRLYLDGVEVDTATLSVDMRDVTDAGVLVGATRGEYAWKGRIDDARIYNYVVSPEQIASMYAGNDDIIVANETTLGEHWQARVTGFSSTEASVPYASATITIGATNQPPTLAAIGAQSIDENATLSFTVTATDPDMTIPSLSADPLPANASFADNGDGTGSFSFTPDFDQAGTYDITFACSDGVDSDEELVTITVNNVNRAPVVAAVGNQLVDEGQLLELTVTADDPDGDALTMSIVDLPENALFTDNNDNTADFSFAPSYLQAGVYTVWFRTFDGAGDGDSVMVEITVVDIPVNSLWSATIHSQGETDGTAVTEASVIIGVNLDAQSTAASPFPPSYTTSLQLRAADFSGPYFRDIQAVGQDCYYWTVDLDPHGNSGSPATSRCATLSWEPLEFSPDHHYVLREGSSPDGPVVVADMRTTTNYQVCDIQTSRYYTVHWESDACAAAEWATLSLSEGWNLVSLPVIPASMDIADLIPTAEVAYEFDGIYSEVTAFEPCVGYWVKVPAAVDIVLSGTPITDCSLSLTTGWHLVGAPTCTATPSTTPGGALQSMFGFDGAYQVASQTTAGNAYWAEISPDADLNITCGGSSAPSTPATMLTGPGSRMTLRAQRSADHGMVEQAIVELGADNQSSTLVAPPSAPEYAVRLNLYKEDLARPFFRDVRNDDLDNIWIIAVNPHGNDPSRSETTAILSWDNAELGDDVYELREGIGVDGPVVIADMSDATSIEVTGSNQDQFFTIVRSAASLTALPEAYELSQNYPNPFNPSTQISFTVPTSQSVRIDVFNVLGQKVITLIDGQVAAGEHTVTWNAVDQSGSQVSSGVYFYRLQTADFSDTRKMMLLR